MPLPFTQYFGRNNEICVTSSDARTANPEDDVRVLDISSDPDDSYMFRVKNPEDGTTIIAFDGDATQTTGILKMGVSAAWIQLGTTAGRVGAKWMFEGTATTGTAWGHQIRCKASAAAASDTATAAVVALNVSASSGIASAGGLQGIQSYVQPAYALSGPNAICTALYGCIDNPNNVDMLSRNWTLWIDAHRNVKAGGGDYLARFSNNAHNSGGDCALDGLFTIYNGAGMDNFINFEDVAGFLSTSASGTFTKTHKIKVAIAGVTGPSYIEVGTIE